MVSKQATGTTVRKPRAVVPRFFLVPTLLALIFVISPFAGMFGQISWGSIGKVLTTQQAQDALFLSLRTCITSTIIATILGVPTAHFMAFIGKRGKAGAIVSRVMNALVTLPMVLPPVVAGLALLVTFGRRGLLGATLDAWGITIGFTSIAVVMAQTFVAMPFLIVSYEGALRTRGTSLERAATNLGARPWRVYRTITLPLTLPALASGIALTFARALGEFGATLTFAGSLQGVTRTLPLEIYVQRELDTQSALTLSLILLIIAVVVIALTSLLTARRALSSARTPREKTDTTSEIRAMAGLARTRRNRPQEAEGAAAVLDHARVNVRSVDLTANLARGQLTAVVGPNGAGKSTLLQMLSGALTPDEGRVSWLLGDGAPQLAWLEQRALLFPHMSVLENVTYGLTTHGVPAKTAHKRALEELRAVGCAHLAQRHPDQLSGGQAQRVAIARALALDPDVVLLDEPLAAVDFSTAWNLRLVLANRIAASNVTAILVTHDLDDVASLADDLIVIESGKVVEAGPAQQLLAHPQSDFLVALTGANRLDVNGRSVVAAPQALALKTEQVEPANSNQVCAEVLESIPTGRGWLIIVETSAGDFVAVAQTGEHAQLQPGTRVVVDAAAGAGGPVQENR
ncbi:ABC transporter permease [Gleimia hominis]|uniref:ABC transporter permease n=1 Tax=Gleimia hominis TaxID=595468 RepID=A0ABU3IAG4_9ACTO|nr:ABC transporter permease [Gleimia hominis]MDT3767363.1 ABC transporter permease [Gleimia hominis]